MNIGIFTDTYYPQINGVVTSVRMLERELNRLGHKVYIFTTTDPKIDYVLPRVFRLPSMPLIFLKTHRVAFFYSPKLLLKMKSLKLDLVHTQTEFPLGFFGKLVSELCRIPMVHTYHTMYEDYVHYVANGYLITPKGAQKFSRLFCNRAKMVIAPVDKTKNYLQEIGVSRPIVTVPTGLDFTPFARSRYSAETLDAVRRELGLAPTDKVVLTVGRIAKEKSIDVLVGMMPKLRARIPNAKLVIIGDGPLREALQAQAQRLGVADAVIFAGFRPWETIGQYYQIGDIFATASTSETQGLTYIEAMAAGVPVVIKKDPSFEGLIQHGVTGFMFTRDEEASDAAAYVLEHPDEAQAVTARGLDAIQPLSARQFGMAMEAIYKQLLAHDI